MNIHRSRSTKAHALALAIAIGATTVLTNASPALAQETPVVDNTTTGTSLPTGDHVGDNNTYTSSNPADILLSPGSEVTIELPENATDYRTSATITGEVSTQKKTWLDSLITVNEDERTVTISLPDQYLLSETNTEVSWNDPRVIEEGLTLTYVSTDGEKAQQVNVTTPADGEYRLVKMFVDGFPDTNVNVRQGSTWNSPKTFPSNVSAGILREAGATIPETVTDDRAVNLVGNVQLTPEWMSVNTQKRPIASPTYSVSPGDKVIGINLESISPDVGSGIDLGAYYLTDKISVTPANLASQHDYSYRDITTERAGETVTGSPFWGETPAPSGVRAPVYSIGEGFTAPDRWRVAVNPVTGVVTVNTPSSLDDTTVTVPVIATYPDKTMDRAELKVIKDHDDTERYNPDWDDTLTVNPPARTTLGLKSAVSLPEGTRIDVSGLSRDWLTGVNDDWTIAVSAPDNAEHDSSHTMTITVIYPDGSRETDTVEVTVNNPSLADSHNPTWDTEDNVPQHTTGVYSPGFNVPRTPEVTSWEINDAPDWVTINEDTGVITATPGEGQEPGTVVNATVIVNYGDGSVDRENITITVGDPEVTHGVDLYYRDGETVRLSTTRTIAPSFRPSSPAGSVSFELINSPEWVTIDQSTGMVTLSPELGVTMGAHTFNVTVTYADGSTDTSRVTVEVGDQYLHESTDVNVRDATITRGQSVNVSPQMTPTVPSGTTFSLKDSPDWITVNEDTGVITLSPLNDTETGDMTYTLVSTYSDGSVDETEAKVTVREHSAGTQAYWEVATIDQGATGVYESTSIHSGDHSYTLDESAPAWASIDESTGTITVNPPFTVTPGARQIPVTITYPDGSTGTSSFNFTVSRVDQNTWLNPGYAPVSVQAGRKVESDAPNFAGGVPQGNVRYEIDGADWASITSDGVIVVTPPGTTPTGVTELTVTITYSDSSQDTVTVPVSVTDRDYADVYSPNYSQSRVAQDKTATATISYTGETPESVTYEAGPGFPTWATLNSDNGDIKLSPGFDVSPGAHRVPVLVTYADNTTETVTLAVDVSRGADSDRYDFSYPFAEVRQSDRSVLDVRVTDTYAGGVSADITGARFLLVGDNNPSWVSLNQSNGTLAVAPLVDTRMGDYEVTVEILYADGSREQTVVPVRVTGTTDATRYEMQFIRANVEQGDTHSAVPPMRTSGAAAPEGTTFAPVSAPEWLNMNRDGSYRVTPGYDVTPGVYQVPVTVTYQDGSSESGLLSLNVTAADISKDFSSPSYPSSSVVQGEYTSSGSPTDGTRTLPDGTGFRLRYGAPNWVELDATTGSVTAAPGFNVEPGRYDIPVSVIYRDGSSVSTSWTLTVARGKASDSYNPVYTNMDVPQESRVIIPAPRHNGQKLPEGTKFDSVESNPSWISVGLDGTVSGSPKWSDEVGMHKVAVLVTYPDGTTDEVAVNVRVLATPIPEERPEVIPGTGKYRDYTEGDNDNRTGNRIERFEIDPDNPGEEGTVTGESSSTTPGEWTTDEEGNRVFVPSSSSSNPSGPDVNTGGSVAGKGLISWLTGLFR